MNKTFASETFRVSMVALVIFLLVLCSFAAGVCLVVNPVVAPVWALAAIGHVWMGKDFGSERFYN